MAQYYTLDEAAEKLGLTPDAFRKKLATEWKSTPRRYPDGATLRFKVTEVDDLARSLGRGSDADVPLKLADDTSSDDFLPLAGDDALGDVRHKPSTPGSKPKRPAGDSDVRLEPAEGKTRAVQRPSRSEEEIDLDAEQRAKPPSSKKIRPMKPIASEADIHLEPSSPPEGSSEFELSLAPDSSEEFDLQLTEDDSDEVDIGGVRGKGLKAGDSGINLQSPADSGISLERSGDFELQAEDGPAKKGPKTDPTLQQPAAKADSDSEFELTLDDGAASSPVEATTAYQGGEQKDIFETDFELPPLDEESGSSEAVALEDSTDLESSDFDLAIDEGDAEGEDSGSEVVAVDDEDMPRGRRRGIADEEFDELDVADDVEEEREPVRAAAESTEWGVLPAIVMFPCVLVMAVVGLMSWELLHGMWGYQQPGKVASPIVRSLAEMVGEKLPPE